MSAPGFFKASWIVAAKDLRLEWRTFETLSSSMIFSLIVLVIFNFAFGFATVRELGAARLVPGVIWIVLAFATARPCDGGTGALYVFLRKQLQQGA